jgi:Ca2+/Na+ antiporter
MSEDKQKKKTDNATNDDELDEIISHDRYNTDIIKGIFLLTLAVSGNYVGETLGCQTEKAMTDNVFIKHGILLMLIYFTINFTSSSNPYPFETVKKTFIIWAMYLMFARMSGAFTMTAIILLMTYYILSNFTDYYGGVYEENIEDAKTTKEKNELVDDFQLIEKQYQDLREYVLYVLIIIVIIGFILYTREKWIEYHDEFSLTKFVLGTGHCKGLDEA